jgi:general secretion pathway protein M
MASILDKLGGLRSKLNARQQRTASFGLVAIALLVFLGLPVVMESIVLARKSENDDMRGALSSIQKARADIRDRQQRKEAIAVRYRSKAPALAGFLEQTARGMKLEVTDSVDRPVVPYGKRYQERSTVIHLKKAGMANIARFLEAIEKSGHAIAISRLNIRKRSAEQDSYDVEVGVSAYDRIEAPPPAGADDKAKKP